MLAKPLTSFFTCRSPWPITVCHGATCRKCWLHVAVHLGAPTQAGRIRAYYHLVAKLHLGAHDLYKEADAVLNENIRDFNRISRKLQAYILLGASVHRARAYRCAAEEAFAAGDIGEAIACCDAANKHLARGRDAAGEADRWKTAALEESEALMNLRKKYVTENEVVYFEKVPERPAKKLPDGKVIVSEIEHVPVSIDVLSLE